MELQSLEVELTCSEADDGDGSAIVELYPLRKCGCHDE